jgi:hypothetical protein
MVTPGVNRPFISNTASVVRSPEIIFRGTNRIRAFFAAGADCSSAAETTHDVAVAINIPIANIRGFMKVIIEEPL